MKRLDSVVTVIIIIGALNWGLIGLFSFDIVDFFFERIWVDRLIYAVVGFSGLFKIIYWATGNWTTHFEEIK